MGSFEISAVAPSVRLRALLSVSAGALLALAAPAYAQTAPAAEPAAAAADPAPVSAGPAAAAPAASADDAADIIVTGSRIVSAGYNAPTPTQVLGAADIARNAQPNIFTTIAQLPSLQGSSGVTTGTNSTSSGQQGLSSFSLRGLGTIRTLTLLDGQRVVGANVTGVPDISQFPQLLVQRVDVVTGGASASYGSDAVGGVVNFITDKKFEGFKANVLGGVTTYGDDKQILVQAAAGHAFLDNRLHVEVSGEYAHEGGVPAGENGGFGEDMANGRDWYRTSTLINRGVTNDGSPQYLYRDHAQAYQYTRYGLITNGPLQGTAFDANGKSFPFVYGSNGVPSKTAAGTVSGCYIGFCTGGDLSGNVGIGTSLQSRLTRMNGYGRVGFDLDADNEIYGTINVAQVRTSNQPNPGATKTGLNIQCSNPYVPADIQAACAANNITSFQLGTSSGFLPENINVHTQRTQYRGVLGADGKFDVLGSTWRYDAYYEHGENVSNIHVRDISLTPRFTQAVQAISLNGQIVCADPTARANGCVPINVIGGTTPSAAALEYIEPTNGPFQHTRQKQDVASVSFSGEPFSLWAGPVSVAFGGEYRREAYRVTGDPYGNGLAAGGAYDADYPADPLLSTNGNNWYAGNYHNGSGSYNVKEAFLEVNVPVLDSDTLGKANINAAGRWTDYSTSGTVYTWKIGGTWQTPIEAIRLRAVTSRDVRAPNLSELFAAPISITVPNFTNPFNNTAITILQNTIGNTALKPEIARNTEVGIVLSKPKFLPGFSLSVDYYHIRIKGVVSTLSAQQEVNLCQAGSTQLCSAFDLAPTDGSSPYVNVQSFNLASITTSGFDIEGSYRFSLDPFKLPGNITVRGLGTNVRKYVTDTGIPGTIPIDTAGANSGNTPHWKILGIESWDNDKVSVTLQQRWFSNGVFGNQYIVCGVGTCPIQTALQAANNPTVDYNKMKGAFYFDVGGSYKVTPKLTAYFKVDNVFNRSPTPSPQTNTGVDVNPALYDVLGRMFRAGLRFGF